MNHERRKSLIKSSINSNDFKLDSIERNKLKFIEISEKRSKNLDYLTINKYYFQGKIKENLKKDKIDEKIFDKIKYPNTSKLINKENDEENLISNFRKNYNEITLGGKYFRQFLELFEKKYDDKEINNITIDKSLNLINYNSCRNILDVNKLQNEENLYNPENDEIKRENIFKFSKNILYEHKTFQTKPRSSLFNRKGLQNHEKIYFANQEKDENRKKNFDLIICKKYLEKKIRPTSVEFEKKNIIQNYNTSKGEEKNVKDISKTNKDNKLIKKKSNEIFTNEENKMKKMKRLGDKLYKNDHKMNLNNLLINKKMNDRANQIMKKHFETAFPKININKKYSIEKENNEIKEKDLKYNFSQRNILSHKKKSESLTKIENPKLEKNEFDYFKFKNLSISNLPLINPFDGKIENYLIGKEIGKGSYASVKLAISKINGYKYAIKIYEKCELSNIIKKDSVKREINVLKQVNHENIVKMYEFIETQKQILIVMENINGVSLLDFMEEKPNRRIDEELAKYIFSQIVDALNYLHKLNIYHRDIKLENILINKNDMKVKIIDFGFGICCSSKKLLDFYCGTPYYMAPEIVKKKEYYGNYVDIWSLGVLLYFSLCGNFPFKAFTEKELYEKILKGNFIIPHHLSTEAQNLIKNILRINPRSRIECDKMIEDDWFKIKIEDEKIEDFQN